MKKNRKVLSAILAVVSVCALSSGAGILAVSKNASLKDASLENSFIRLTVEQDKNQGEYLKFRLDSTGGQISNADDDNRKLTYGNFYSGYTTVNVNGNLYTYGTGEDVSGPHYDVDKKCHVSSQKFGDVTVEQTLTFTQLDTPDYEDVLKISYKVLEYGSDDTKIGFRVLIDPMIDNDDALKMYAEKVNVQNEAVFTGNLPSEWTAVKTDNESVFAYGKLPDSQIKPDSIIFADWNSLYDNSWNYEPDINKRIGDAAAAVTWNLSEIKKDREYTAYYGIKNTANTGTQNKTVLTTPKTGGKTIAGTAACFAVSAVCAVLSCRTFRRKEKKSEK